MEEALLNFSKQFNYEPVIENGETFTASKKMIVVGMGGSHLAAGLLKACDRSLDILVHRNYGLPDISEENLKSRLVVLSSYSGNTEEVADAFQKALEKKLPVLAVSTGGKILEIAKKNKSPFIKLPDAGIQPRTAVGLSFLAFLKAAGDEDALREIKNLETALNPSRYEAEGKELAQKLKNFVPVVYTSEKNEGLAYIWKISFNETGKVPAFYNVLPELNHNEMTSFDTLNDLSKNFHFIFLKDAKDDPRIQKRMDILEKLFKNRGFGVEVKNLEESSVSKSSQSGVFFKVFSSVILAGWTALYTAKAYGLEPEEVPMVEEFKKLIK
ncbi:hypothetical protein HYT01_03635 [Candidatus Giovannonibacteria bacterium]|nr:hypothetical protein [Candidatus Giovannonibacteria bacterium]